MTKEKQIKVPEQSDFDALAMNAVRGGVVPGKCGYCSGRCSCSGKSAARREKPKDAKR